MRKTVILFTLILLILTACGNSNGSYQTIDMEQTKKMIEKDSDIIVLDVRTVEEYNEGHIAGALLYPVQEIESRVSELDKKKTYIVVCRSGNRSKTASDILVKNGFADVYNTSGGMNQWSGLVEK